MNTENDHWDEIVGMVKTANRNNPTELEPDRIGRIHANVFSHINSMYPLDERVEDRSWQNTSGKKGLLGKLTDQLPGIRIFANSEKKIPALAVIAVAIVSIGLLTKIGVKQAPYFDLPDSVVSADIQPHIESLSNGSRALTASTSTRRIDFIIGVIQAGIDLAGIENETTAGNVIALLTKEPSTNKNLPRSELLALFQDRVSATENSVESLTWFTEGYYIELIHLCAKYTLESFDTGPLLAAMEQWNQQGELRVGIVRSEELLPNYISKRRELQTTTSLWSPDDWQSVVDITRSLKVLAR